MLCRSTTGEGAAMWLNSSLNACGKLYRDGPFVGDEGIDMDSWICDVDAVGWSVWWPL